MFPPAICSPKAGGSWGLDRHQGDAETGIAENDQFLILYEHIEVMDVRSSSNYALPALAPLETAVDDFNRQQQRASAASRRGMNFPLSLLKLMC